MTAEYLSTLPWQQYFDGLILRGLTPRNYQTACEALTLKQVGFYSDRVGKSDLKDVILPATQISKAGVVLNAK